MNDIYDTLSSTLLHEQKEKLKSKISIEFGDSATEFVLYFKYSNSKSTGRSLLDGWVSYAFLSNKPLSKVKKGDRVIGRTMPLSRLKTFDEVVRGLSDKSATGSYSAIGTFDETSENFVFETSIMGGRWKIQSDPTSKKHAPRVWLIRTS